MHYPYVCDYCGEEIKEKKYALPYDNYENVCHEDCVEGWFEDHIREVACEHTIYVEED